MIKQAKVFWFFFSKKTILSSIPCNSLALTLCATGLFVAACAPLPPSPPPGPAPASAAQTLGPPELDQLVAPVALYDDALLADVLTAATYPGEVVQALRWTQVPGNAALKATALTTALAAQDWDPSVKSLVPFPAILTTMDSHLEWTQHLGEAFLAQPAAVMQAVQDLRVRAQQAGTLHSSPQEVVAQTGTYLTIAPPPSQMIYVPTYNPWCAYGAWPYPASGPFYYEPYAGNCMADDAQLDWSLGLYQPFDYWGWGYFDWGRGELLINRGFYGRFGGWDHRGGFGGSNVWQHNSGHRAGIPYSTPGNAARFGGGAGAQGYHGYAGSNGEPANTAHGTAPAWEGVGSGRAAWGESARGQASRGFSGGGFHGGGGFSHGGGFGGGSHGGGGGGGGGHR